MFRLIDCNDPAWDAYVGWFTDDPHYSSAYYRAFGGGKLAIFEENNECLVQPFLEQGGNWLGNAYNFGGPLGQYAYLGEFTSHFNEWKTAQGLNERCTLNPFLAQPRPLHTPVSEKEVVFIDLEHSVKLRSTTRHLVAKAAEAGAVTRIIEGKELDYAVPCFEGLYHEAMGRKGAAAHWYYPQGFFQKVLAELGPTRSALFVTEIAGIAEAGCILIFSPDVCYYHWAVTRPYLTVQGISHFQVNEIINWAKAQGIRKLHLGGGLQGRDGLFTFKSGFSNLTLPCVFYETCAQKEAAA